MTHLPADVEQYHKKQNKKTPFELNMWKQNLSMVALRWIDSESAFIVVHTHE